LLEAIEAVIMFILQIFGYGVINKEGSETQSQSRNQEDEK